MTPVPQLALYGDPEPLCKLEYHNRSSYKAEE